MQWISRLLLSLLTLALTVSSSGAAELDTVRGIFGKEHVLKELKDAPTQAVVLVFLDPDCPVVQQYVPLLRDLYHHYNQVPLNRAGQPVRRNEQGRLVTYKYPGDRVVFLGIYATPNISLKEIAEHAVMAGIPFRVVHDHQQSVMRRYDVKELGEVVVLDANWNVFYQGTVDDQFYPGGAKPEPQEHYLRDALDALLDGKSIQVPRRPPQGCIIPKIDVPRKYPEVTFHQHVEPIFQARCQQCHREGAVGPMELISYDDAARYAEMIEEVVLDGRMPPWPGQTSRRLIDAELLTAQERETIVAWVRGGYQQGDLKLAPAPKTWPAESEWRIGKPDLILEMPQPFAVPSHGLINYVYRPIQANFPPGKYIKAIETKPGVPSVVHHIQVHEYTQPVDPNRSKGLNPLEQLMLYGTSIDNAKLLGSFTPGNNANARFYGPDLGMKVEAGANLIMELHYTPNGTPATDRSQVGIIFTDQKPKRELKTHYFLRKRGDFVIPANRQNHSLQHLYHFENSVLIRSIRPHMHTRAKSFRLELVDSADVRLKDVHDMSSHHKIRGEVLLTIPIWDYNWQRTYEFAEPIAVPRGKALLGTAFYDNTKHNPRNPDASVDVPWGQQTHQEMFNILFLYEELEAEKSVTSDRTAVSVRVER